MGAMPQSSILAGDIGDQDVGDYVPEDDHSGLLKAFAQDDKVGTIGERTVETTNVGMVEQDLKEGIAQFWLARIGGLCAAIAHLKAERKNHHCPYAPVFHHGHNELVVHLDIFRKRLLVSSFFLCSFVFGHMTC